MSVEKSERCATLRTEKEDTVRILNFIMFTPPINHKQTLLVWLFVTLEMFKLGVLISLSGSQAKRIHSQEFQS